MGVFEPASRTIPFFRSHIHLKVNTKALFFFADPKTSDLLPWKQLFLDPYGEWSEPVKDGVSYPWENSHLLSRK